MFDFKFRFLSSDFCLALRVLTLIVTTAGTHPARAVFTTSTNDSDEPQSSGLQEGMHHCLEIPEVVHLVFSKLTPIGAGAKDLAALARTCTTFHDIALDALWWYQYSIVNLIRCMPADLWDTVFLNGTDTLVRDLRTCTYLS